MKLERLHEYLAVFLATTGGMLLAVYAGRLSGSGHLGTLAMIIAGLIIGFFLFTLKTRIWMFIPMAWMLTGQVPILPLPFSVRDLVVFAVAAVMLTLMALKLVKRRPKYGWLDFALFVNLLYLVTVFIRNPVGTQAFNSERVGGRPYFEVAVACLAYLVLIRSSASLKEIRWFPVVVTVGGFLQAAIGLITMFFPATVPLVLPFYTAITTEQYDAMDVRRQGEGSGRFAYLTYLGRPITDAMVSYFPPLTLINPFYLVRFLIYVSGGVLLLLSGFRSAIIGMAFSFLIAAYIKRGISDLIKASFIAVPFIIFLLLGQGTLFNLPKPVQRALSFLPAQWDSAAVDDAEGSTRWRVEMWKYMLLESKYIDNKLLGDGFGFSQNEMALMQHLTTSNLGSSQEWFMLVGAVHSGPVSTIRYAGYVGLALYSWFLIAAAVTAYRIVQRTRGSEMFLPSLFVCIPVLYEPFYYWVIFGSYDSAFPNAIYAAGLLKMLENSLNDQDVRKSKMDQPDPKENLLQGAKHKPHLSLTPA